MSTGAAGANISVHVGRLIVQVERARPTAGAVVPIPASDQRP